MYTIRRRQDGSYCIYLKDFAVVVAEFMPGYNKDAKNIKAIFEEQATTERQRDELLAFIQGLEWIPHPDYRASKNALYCPSCQRGIKAGHASDCTLAAIARARSSGSGQAGEGQEG